MPIVSKFSNLFRDELAGGEVADPAIVSGRMYTATGNLANASDDSSGSKYKIAKLPADCLLDERTFFDVENWGYANIRIGTLTDIGALVSQTKATENMVTPVAPGDANHGKRLWEILGLAKNPGGWIDLYAHGNADAVAAGAMPFRIAWITN